jgi:flavodoxin
MKVLIVYDSFFGNTEKIALAIGKALGSAPEVEVVRVNAVKPEQLTGLQWLIVGSPTRGFNPSPLIKAFLAGIPADALRGVKVAAFDTRYPASKIPGFLRLLFTPLGFADRRIVAGLTKKGGELAAPSGGFYVLDTEGPLQEGELERAAAWAKQLTAAG